jgi:hypothetical protein
MCEVSRDMDVERLTRHKGSRRASLLRVALRADTQGALAALRAAAA